MAEVEVSKTFEAAVERSKKIEADLLVNPKKYKVLTGDRPTGRLHIGHYFGSLLNRVRLSKMGVPTCILIADYQVLTDHEAFSEISQNTKQLVIDYLAAGIEPSDDVIIYPHSYVPECNQLMLPFLTLVSNAELSRNPTVKEEIEAAGLKNVNAGMYTYPIHQACDILFCKGNVVPVGKDQEQNMEMARLFARRFNRIYNIEYFKEPQSFHFSDKAVKVPGLDGSGKMGKSEGNAIYLCDDEATIKKKVMRAVTDSGPTMLNQEKPEAIQNLFTLMALVSTPDTYDYFNDQYNNMAIRYGDMKKQLAADINAFCAPIRERIIDFKNNDEYLAKVAREGAEAAAESAEKTIREVREIIGFRD